MFAEPIYLRAYQRGVFAAAKTFCSLYATGEIPAKEWPLSRADALQFVMDLAPEKDPIAQRLAALAFAGARNEWRNLTDALQRRSGVFLKPEQPAGDGSQAGGM